MVSSALPAKQAGLSRVATMESASGKSFTTDLIMTATDSASGLRREQILSRDGAESESENFRIRQIEAVRNRETNLARVGEIPFALGYRVKSNRRIPATLAS